MDIEVEDIIDACKRDDPTARQTLYGRIAPIVMGICKRYLLDMKEAEDVFLRVMRSVFNRITEYKEQTSFMNWVKDQLVDEALSKLKSKKELYVSLNADRSDHKADIPEHDLTLIETLAKLSIGCRTVFNLHEMEGMEHWEIAERLNISEGTSKYLLEWANDELYEVLTKEKE